MPPSPRVKKGLAKTTGGRGLRSNNTRASQALMVNDNGMFETDKGDGSDKENSAPSEPKVSTDRKRKATFIFIENARAKAAKTGLKANRTSLGQEQQAEPHKTLSKSSAPAMKKQMAAKKAERNTVAPESEVEKAPTKRQFKSLAEAARDMQRQPDVKKVVAEKKAAAVSKQPERKKGILEPLKAAKQPEADDVKSKPQPGLIEKNKPMPPATKAPEREESTPELLKPAVATKKAPIANTSETANNAHDIISKRRSTLTDEELENFPTHLSEVENPQVLMRLLNNSNKRCTMISSRRKALEAQKGQVNHDAALSDITNEIEALTIEGKFLGALSHLAQRKIGELEKENIDPDAKMDDAE